MACLRNGSLGERSGRSGSGHQLRGWVIHPFLCDRSMGKLELSAVEELCHLGQAEGRFPGQGDGRLYQDTQARQFHRPELFHR
jgi:hypothetical protein